MMLFWLLLGSVAWADRLTSNEMLADPSKYARPPLYDSTKIYRAEQLPMFKNFEKAPLPPPLPPSKKPETRPKNNNQKNAADSAANSAAEGTKASKGRPSGIANDAAVVDAANGGARTIGEYFRMIPRLVEEQKHAAKAATRFEATATRLAENHSNLARSYTVQRNQVARSETNLGAMGSLAPMPAGGGAVSGAPVPAPRSSLTTPAPQSSASIPIEKKEEREAFKVADSSEPLTASLGQFDGNLDKGSSISPASELAPADDSAARSIRGRAIDSKNEKLARDALRAKLKQRGKFLGGEGTGEELEEELAEAEEPAPTDVLLSAYEAAELEKKASFSMLHSETDEYIGNFKREVASIELPPEVLDEESDELFKRVNEAHRRSLKRGDVKLAAVSKR